MSFIVKDTGFTSDDWQGGFATADELWTTIGLLVREYYISSKLHEDPPLAPGLAAAWALHEQRGKQP